MKKILLILMACLLLSACGQLGLNKQPTTIAQFTNYGPGINIQLIDPPEMTIEQELLIFSYRIVNTGKHTIDQDKLFVSLSYPPQQFSQINLLAEQFSQSNKGRTLQYRDTLQAANAFFPEGGETSLVRYNLQSKDIRLGEQEFKFTINACYEYKTIIDINDLCLGARTGIGSCQFPAEGKDLALPKNQGAPIQVKNIKQRILPGSTPDTVIPKLTIEIQNVGRGIAYRSGKNIENSCTGKTIEDPGKIDYTLTVSTYSFDSRKETAQDFKCSPDLIWLRDGRARIDCQLVNEISASAAQTTVAELQLLYGYTSKLSHTVTVKSAQG